MTRQGSQQSFRLEFDDCGWGHYLCDLAAIDAKIELSSATSSRVLLPHLADAPDGPYHLDHTISRQEFEAGTHDLLARCELPIRRALDEADPIYRDIDQAILTGGATRMPALEPMVRLATGCARFNQGLIPEGIATGAALAAGVLTGTVKDTLLLDVGSAQKIR